MAVSLVSTGVQFPDATIQTTAAALPLGATAQYSVVGPTPSGNNVCAFNPAGLSTGNYTVAPTGPYSGSAPKEMGNPRWSSYYQFWYVLMSNEAGSGQALYFSKTGVYWNIVITDLDTTIGRAVTSYAGDTQQTTFAIDDSNGRMFYAYTDGTNAYVVYSNITAGVTINSGWTTSSAIAACTSVSSLRYCKMSTTAASGLVFSFANGTTMRIFTCPAGSTTFTSRINTASGTSNPRMPFWFEENGKMFVPATGGSAVLYNTTGDIATGWTVGSVVSPEPATQGRMSCVGNGYMVYPNSNSLYYSTTGSGASWTNSGLSAAANIAVVFYTGSNFIVQTDGNQNRVYTYISAGNTPTSFTLLATSLTPQLGLFILQRMGQRLTAT